MARTTIAEVKEIIDTELEDANITAYIDSANIMVTEVVGDSDMSASFLIEIERWLTAHMISITKERQAKKQEVNKAKIEYTGVYGDQLKMTSYGQMVLVWDTSNSFNNLGKKNATITAVTGYNNRGE